MNRHERRKAFAQGVKAVQTGEFPPEYLRVIKAIIYAFLQYRRQLPDREPPRFALPPKGIIVIVSLDEPSIIPRIARNETARQFLAGIVEGAVAERDSKAMPTLFMLSVALETVGAEIERVSLADLGLSVGGVQGRNN